MASEHVTALRALIGDLLNRLATLAPYGGYLVAGESMIQSARLVMAHSAAVKLFTNWTLKVAPSNVVRAPDRLSCFVLDVHLLIQRLFVVPLR